jgi:CDP-glucose 4,6-dehydratase
MEDMAIISLAEFYRGKRVFLTGHTGFKGSWLAIWLKLIGADVIGLALPPHTTPSLFQSADIDRGIQSTFADIRDPEQVEKLFERSQPEIVIHNAAQSLVRRSYREPVETYATNVMGTVHVLDAARRTQSVRSIVVVTSDKCYENRERSHGYSEEEAMGGQDPYSSSKGCAELVTSAYRRSFFNSEQNASVATVRAGNVIGGGDWSEDRLIPDIVKAITASQPVVIRRPEAIRPWQHVLEPLRGYLILGQQLWERTKHLASGWNFGPSEDDAIPVGQLAARFVNTWGKGELRIQADPAAPHEAQFLRLDCSKACQQLGWRPILALSDALDWTVEWYQAFYENAASARSITEMQINRYHRMMPS